MRPSLMPPPPKKKYEIMKDPIFLSSPIYLPFLPPKPSLSTTRDDHLIPLLLHDRFTFKAQLSFVYVHPTDYTVRLYDLNQGFFSSIASKIMSPYQYWLDNGVKIFSLQFTFLRLYYLRNYDPIQQYFCLLPQKDTSIPLIVPRVLNSNILTELPGVFHRYLTSTSSLGFLVTGLFHRHPTSTSSPVNTFSRKRCTERTLNYHSSISNTNL